MFTGNTDFYFLSYVIIMLQDVSKGFEIYRQP